MILSPPDNYFVKHISMAASAALKKICLCGSIDRYNTDPGGQATYHDDHKIAFSLWRKWIRTVECGILAIKKTSAKTFQIELYSVFLSVPIKHVQEKEKGKEIWLWKKNNILLSQFLVNCNIEKTKVMIFYVNFSMSMSTSRAYIYLVDGIYFWFLLFANTRHVHKLIRVKN